VLSKKKVHSELVLMSAEISKDDILSKHSR